MNTPMSLTVTEDVLANYDSLKHPKHEGAEYSLWNN